MVVLTADGNVYFETMRLSSMSPSPASLSAGGALDHHSIMRGCLSHKRAFQKLIQHVLKGLSTQFAVNSLTFFILFVCRI